MNRVYSFWVTVCCLFSLSCYGDPNKPIDFSDPFYRGILDSYTSTSAWTVPEGSKVDANELSLRAIETGKKRIQSEADSACKEYLKSRKQWDFLDASSESYHAAALNVCTHMELNQKQWLTVGNILHTFGEPDEMYYDGYTFDWNDCINPTNSRLSIYYAQKCVFMFSTTGFLNAVVVEVTSTYRYGKGIPWWPQKYDYTDHYPIEVCTESECKNERLSEKIAAYSKQGLTDWLKVVGIVKNVNNSLNPCKSQLIMIDYVRDDLVCTYFKVSIKDIVLHCNVWWVLKNNNWVSIPDQEAVNLICPNSQESEAEDSSEPSGIDSN